MTTQLKKFFETKLSEIIVQARTMQQDYKYEIGCNEDVEIDIEAGIVSLECALKAYQETPEEDGSDSLDKHQATEGHMKNFI